MNKALSSERQLRIALLGYRSHPHVGGQGIYLHYLSKALVALGHQVCVFSGPPYPELVAGVELVKIPGLDLYSKEKPLRSIGMKNLLNRFDRREWLSKLSGGFAEPELFCARLLDQYTQRLAQFDIIHDNQSLGFALLNLLNGPAKLIVTIHHPIHRDLHFALSEAKDWFHRLLLKRWYRFLSMQEKVAERLPHIITVSQQSRADIIKHFPVDEKNIEIIANGIDTQRFKPLDVKKNPFRIITTASSDQTLKGLHTLLDAVAITRKSLPDIQLRVIGKLKHNSLAHKRLHELKLSESVNFKSGISTEELVHEYNQASLAVCPSLYEGFGIPALEAMACGLPLISSDGGALPEVVGDAALIFNAGDEQELARMILNVLTNKPLATDLSKRALDRVQQSYDWLGIGRAYTTFYQHCLAQDAYIEP